MDFLVERPSPEGDETDRQSLRFARPESAGRNQRRWWLKPAHRSSVRPRRSTARRRAAPARRRTGGIDG